MRALREEMTAQEEAEWRGLALLESGAVPWKEPEPEWKKWRDRWGARLAEAGELIVKKVSRSSDGG